MEHPTHLRRAVATVVVVSMLLAGGCLTIDPSVSADTGGSAVFESVESTEPWSSGQVRASVSLTDEATTSSGVSKLVVVSSRGTSFYTTTLEPGESSTTLFLPPNAEATVLAVNTVNGTVVETITVRTDGDRLV
jgi:hypothetical protein